LAQAQHRAVQEVEWLANMTTTDKSPGHVAIFNQVFHPRVMEAGLAALAILVVRILSKETFVLDP
jgi:hypothetical protein